MLWSFVLEELALLFHFTRQPTFYQNTTKVCRHPSQNLLYPWVQFVEGKYKIRSSKLVHNMWRCMSKPGWIGRRVKLRDSWKMPWGWFLVILRFLEINDATDVLKCSVQVRRWNFIDKVLHCWQTCFGLNSNLKNVSTLNAIISVSLFRTIQFQILITSL